MEAVPSRARDLRPAPGGRPVHGADQDPAGRPRGEPAPRARIGDRGARTRLRALHDAPELPAPLRPAPLGRGRHAARDGGRAHDARGVRQLRPQRDLLPLCRRRPGRALRRDALCRGDHAPSPAAPAQRDPAPEVQDRGRRVPRGPRLRGDQRPRPPRATPRRRAPGLPRHGRGRDGDARRDGAPPPRGAPRERGARRGRGRRARLPRARRPRAPEPEPAQVPRPGHGLGGLARGLRARARPGARRRRDPAPVRSRGGSPRGREQAERAARAPAPTLDRSRGGPGTRGDAARAGPRPTAGRRERSPPLARDERPTAAPGRLRARDGDAPPGRRDRGTAPRPR